jgi:hypothetical protein
MSFFINIVEDVIDTAIDLVEGVVDFVFDAVDFVVDEIIQPVVSTVGDVIEYALDDPIKAIATVAAIATGNTWAIPLIDGAATLANGGSLGDAVKAAAISYAGGKLGSVTGQYASTALKEAGTSAVVANIVGAGTKSATTALVYGQDPLKAFATGGLQAGVAAGLGKISETMQEQYGSKFEDLQRGVKDTIFAGLAAELEGGNLSETQMGSIVARYSGVGDAMNNFLKDNAGFSEAQAAILTNATAAAVSKAIAGNPDGAGEAFFGSISAAGAEALKTIVDKPVNNAIDKVTGAYDAAEVKAKALNDTVEAAKNAADTYNSLQSELAVKVQEQARLEEVYNTAVAAYNANPSEAGGNAANAAAEAYNEYARALETDYNNNYKTQMANAEATFTSNNAKIADLEADYNDAMGWIVSKTEDLDAELKPKLSAADKAVALSLRPNFDEDAYRKLNGLDAGADVYDHFLQQGQKLPTDLDGANAVLSASHGDLIKQILATEGMDVSSMEPESLRAVGEHVVNNVKSIKDIAGLDFDSFASEALNKAREATPEGGVLPEGFSREDGILDSDIANGKATLGVTSTGELQWQNTKKRNERLTGSGSGSYTIEDIERSMSAQLGGVISVKFVGTAPTLPEMINMAMEGDFGSLSTATLGTIASLNNETGRLLDEYVNTPIYDSAKAVYNYLNEETDGGLGNAGSIVVGAGGEILQAVAGLAVLAGANPNNSLGRTAKNMIALSGDMKSDEWKAAAKEMQDNSDNYDAEWREDNPGKEPSMAQKAYLKTAAIFGNIKDHPLQWVSENIVSELLQEVPILLASGGTGNVAKRLLLEAGEAHAKKVAARVAIGTGITIDAAEAFGGTAAGAFDEAYSTALNTGMSAQEATDYAIDVAQKAGTIAFITMAATAGIGGQALSKSLFGNKGSEFFAESYDVIKKKVKEGAKVTIKEGVTEGIEEALPQLYIGTALHQIDPSYDVVGSVAEAAVMGKIAGAGTAGGIYTGNALADSLLTTNSTVKNAVANSGDATKATQALKDLGISDNEVLNNLLNTTYDAQYVTTTEAGEMFTVENPGFIPTDAEIEALAGKKDESNLAAEVAAYVDPRFLDVDEVKAAAAAEGVTLTDEQAAAYVGQKNEADAVADIAAEYDPQGTNRDEVEQFFADLGYTPTEEEIAARVGATPDEDQKVAISEYVDPRQVTEAEVRQAFKDQGYEPTDEEVAARVGQGGTDFETNTRTNVGEYVDPRQVTDEEARQFFADLDYIPSDEEVAARVGQVAEAATKEAIDTYVDPRYTTEEEIRQFFEDQGFVPDDRIVERLVGQGGKNAEQMKEMLVAAYVDPRQVTDEEARQFFADQGYEPTNEEVAARVGQGEETFETDTQTGVEGYVDPRQVTEDEARKFFSDQGYEPTDEEVAARVAQGGDGFEDQVATDVGEYIDPRQVTDEEARQFFADLGYNDPTDEQVAQFVAQVEETTQKDVISKYVDPRQVTQAEIQAIADEEGLTLTEALAATYLGQSESETFQTEQLAAARAEYDPLATTLEEATQFFADTGYTADTDELAQFVASKTEEVQNSAIGAYVDPRQMTSDEAREFLSAIGYNPTDQEVADFTGQLNDENYQVTQKAAIDEYVDPRYFDAGEVRAAYEELGLVDVTQEDVDRFVGQFDPEAGGDAEGFESARMDELRTYMPTATFNVIKSIMGSPAVADDPNTEADESKAATGIYAELEAGATRDEALQAAVDKLATDLGTTKDDLLDEIGLSEDRLREEIGAVIDDVTDVKEDVAGVKEDVAGVTEDVGDLADILGTAGVADDPDTEADETQDPTGLFATIKAYEDAGLDRDEALQKAIDDVAGALGTTKDDLLDAIGESETTLTNKIDTATDALTETITAGDTALGEQITDVETGLTETIGDVETSLGADIEAVADLIGKPARDVTQTDIDFVIDLIAQENVSQELITQYDVNADGTVDIADQTLLETALQGDQDVTLADTSMFTPATGLYLQQEQDTQATQDLMTELNTQLNTQINTQDQQQKLRDLVSMEQQGLFKGAKTTVSSADPMNIDYLYDFNSVFANPSQEGLFASPYSTTTRNKAANQPTGPMPTASGFAEGGQVEDENDMLLRILGEM